MELNPFELQIEQICGKFEIQGDSKLDELGFGSPKLLQSNSSEHNEPLLDESNFVSDDVLYTPKKVNFSKQRLSNLSNVSNQSFRTPEKFNLAVKRRILTNSPEAKSPKQSKVDTPKSKYNFNSYEQAITLQSEQNDLLKDLRDGLFSRLDYIIDVLENMDRKIPGDE